MVSVYKTLCATRSFEPFRVTKYTHNMRNLDWDCVRITCKTDIGDNEKKKKYRTEPDAHKQNAARGFLTIMSYKSAITLFNRKDALVASYTYSLFENCL